MRPLSGSGSLVPSGPHWALPVCPTAADLPQVGVFRRCACCAVCVVFVFFLVVEPLSPDASPKPVASLLCVLLFFSCGKPSHTPNS